MVRALKPSELREFSTIVKLNQKELKALMSKTLKKAGYKDILEHEKYIIAIGDIPIALTAHLDTVFSAPPTHVYYDNVQNVLWSPEGLGADDRAGVYGIIKILVSGLKPHIILTTDEEIGGIGARELAKNLCPFPDLRYVIELDRRGDMDCVFYECDNPEFIKYVESFGFASDFGSYSDICEFCPAWEIAGVNLSIGYKNEHTYSETFHVSSFLTTINKVKVMLQEEDIPSFKYIPAIDTWYSKYIRQRTNRFNYCDNCGEYKSIEELTPVLMLNGDIEVLCYDCAKDKIRYCAYCGDAFEIEPDSKNYLCANCEEELIGEGIKINRNPRAI